MHVCTSFIHMHVCMCTDVCSCVPECVVQVCVHACVDCVCKHVCCMSLGTHTCQCPREWVVPPSTLDRPPSFRVPVRAFWVCIWACVFLLRVRARVYSRPCTLFLPSLTARPRPALPVLKGTARPTTARAGSAGPSALEPSVMSGRGRLGGPLQSRRLLRDEWRMSKAASGEIVPTADHVLRVSRSGRACDGRNKAPL